MNTIKTNYSLLTILLLTVCIHLLYTSKANAENHNQLSHEAIKTEVSQFFDEYLGTYNQRFGHPERKDDFIAALSQLIHSPFLMSPPTVKPFQPKDQDQMSQVFDGFVQQLEQKGAVKLKWKSVNLQVLSKNKVLANNMGVAVDKNGVEVYATVSVYLVYQDAGVWKIALFSPYDLDNGIVLVD